MSNHDNTIIKIRRKCDYVKISKNSNNFTFEKNYYNKLNYSYPYDYTTLQKVYLIGYPKK